MNVSRKFPLTVLGTVALLGLSAVVFAIQDDPSPLAQVIDVLPSRKFEVQPLTLEVPPTECDLRGAIGEGFGILASMSPALGTKDVPYYEMRANRRVNLSEPEHEIALYVLNPETCAREVVVITKHAGNLIAPAGWSIDIVKRTNGIRWNYWNTQYDITNPQGWIVIANNYPFEDTVTKTTNTRDARGRTIKRTVKTTLTRYALYSPYSEALLVPDLVLNGHAFMGALTKMAREELRSAGVMSRTYPGMSIADVPVFTDDMFIRLALMEHSDWTEFAASPEGTIGRLLATIGANEERFASYTCNRKSACGIMQFTNTNGNGTYDMVVTKFPTAGLDPDFATGAATPLNAMKAAFLLHDINLADLMAEYGPSIASDPRIEEFLAARYNASPKAVRKSLTPALKNKLAEWTGKLPAETKGYIAKLRWLRDVFPGESLVAENKAVL